MAELPERFDSKRDLDAWLARVVDTYTKYTAPDNAIQNPLDAKEYTTKREHALDLLEEFCEEHVLHYRICMDGITILDNKPMETDFVDFESFENHGHIDPLAASVSVYQSHNHIQEVYDE